MPDTSERKRLARLLIVEDEPSQLRTLTNIMQKEGFAVLGASTAAEAVEHVKREDFGVAVVDLQLPDLAGTRLLEEIQKLGKRIQVIIHTAFGSFDSAKEAVNLGAFAYVEKGGDPEELVRKVHAAHRWHLNRYSEELEEAIAERTTDLRQANKALLAELVERKRAEKALRESEARYADLYDNAPDMYCSVDAVSAKILQCNQTLATATGYRKDEIIGRLIFEMYHPDSMKKAKQAFESFITTGEVHDSELQLKRKDGSRIDVSLSVSAIRDEQGRILRSRSVWRDITERKRAEAQLRSAQQQLVEASHEAGMAEVATGVLHNVGNVLNSVNVSAGLIAEKMRKSRVPNLGKAVELMSEHADDLASYITQDETGKQLPNYLSMLAEHLATEQASIIGELQVITDNVEHIKTIVSMQQSYTEVSGVSQTISLPDMLSDVLKLDASSLANYDIEVVTDYDAVSPVSTDKHKLLQILMNLIKNAKESLIYHDRHPKQLKVRLRSSGEDRVRIEVIDNGVGVPPENLSRMFEYGFTTKKTGHGFGLHSSAVAATEMGGSLTARSDGAGKGATFTLELPMQPASTEHVCYAI